MLLVTVLFALLATSCAWVLRTNVDDIATGTTPNVRLMCQLDHNKDTAIKPQDISRIKIIKDPCCSKTVFADRRVRRNEIAADPTDIKNVTTVLEVTWPIAARNTSGFYGCVIIGFDKDNEIISEMVATTTIKEKTITMKDVEELILSTTKIYDEKLRILETENTNFKKILEGKFQDLSQTIQNQEAKYKSEMSNIKDEMKAKYVLNDELVANVSMLKNFTVNEIHADNILEDKKQTDLLNSIKQTETNCKNNYTTLKSFGENRLNLLNSKLKTLDQVSRKTVTTLSSTLINVTNEINRLDAHLYNATDNLNQLKSELQLCNCVPSTDKSSTESPVDKDRIGTSLSTTSSTAKTSESDVTEWPSGQYALPVSGSQCPETKVYTDKGRHFFSIIYPNSFVLMSRGITSQEIQHGLFTMEGPNGRAGRGFQLCGNEGKIQASPIPWPRGSYCINEHVTQCPLYFKTGYIHTTLDDLKDAKASTLLLMEKFCCRFDGQPTDAIKLPAKKPFILYRHMGVCQQVEGMRVVEVKRVITQAMLSRFRFSASKGGYTPDTDSTGVHMCQYVPKH